MTHDYEQIADAVLKAITNDDFQLRGKPVEILADELRVHFSPQPTKPMEVKQCSAINRVREHKDAYRSAVMEGYGRYCTKEPTRTEVAERAILELEKAHAEDKATHEANIEAIAHNSRIKEELEATVKRLGIPGTYSERDTSSRKQIKPWVTKSSGYISDISRYVKVSDWWDGAVSTYTRRLALFKSNLEEAKRLDEHDRTKGEREAAEALQKREADMKLATMLVRYGLPAVADWRTVLEVVLAKDQRLNLAVAMYRVRQDWNDGPKPVRYALYDPVDETDKLIISCVEDALENWDGDGRIFRDIEWSYDVIFQIVSDQQLVADAMTALEEVDR